MTPNARTWMISALILLAVAAYVVPLISAEEPPQGPAQATWRKLTPEEERVIVRKGTERPFSGEYYAHEAEGTYTCKRCGAALFSSATKFDASCGWPSFDEPLPGAVAETPDADGERTEITCAKCGGHLGHVFRGEKFTPKDTRHCVNSVSLSFEPAAAPPAATQTAYFAGGCFWGVEHLLEAAPGVVDVVSGYMGGHVQNPSYEDVLGHDSGHIETVQVVFDPTKTSYEAVAQLFFEIHDPTQVDRQGPDVGEQYRSVVFYRDEAQRKAAQALIDRLRAQGLEVATKLQPAEGNPFWPAEGYHQDYYKRKGTKPYCHSRTPRFETL